MRKRKFSSILDMPSKRYKKYTRGHGSLPTKLKNRLLNGMNLDLSSQSVSDDLIDINDSDVLNLFNGKIDEHDGKTSLHSYESDSDP